MRVQKLLWSESKYPESTQLLVLFGGYLRLAKVYFAGVGVGGLMVECG
ncbi:MAG: hypothetical protein JSV57_03450 [Candidatus Bathyarchaeota archaeon]|nr:MAG: hypothetical protein JSV57_03450 [Candidatus Bathyarchaeota archaeon]